MLKLSYHPCLQVKTTSLVNFEWERRFYYGNLVAVHKDGDHVAYVLKGEIFVTETRLTTTDL